MKFTQQEDKQFFSITELTFLDIKTIRDGLKHFASDGSAHSAKMAKEIEEQLANMDV